MHCGFQTTFPAILGHFPSGGSTRTLLHYVQSFTSGDFRQYDHGAKRNLLKYGQHSPPVYNVSLVDFPVAISVGDNDWLDSVEVTTTLFQDDFSRSLVQAS